MSQSQRDAPEAPFRDQAGNSIGLLITDMISTFDFDGAEAIKARAVEVARRIDGLRTTIRKRGWPVIFVNDNFGEWHSERSRLVARARKGGNEIARILDPEPDDYFIIKPQLSAFYSTNLPVLLPKLGVRRLIITGMATDMCVLFTAADAHMRDYMLWTPRDALVATDENRAEAALDIMHNSLRCETASTEILTLDAWAAATA